MMIMMVNDDNGGGDSGGKAMLVKGRWDDFEFKPIHSKQRKFQLI